MPDSVNKKSNEPLEDDFVEQDCKTEVYEGLLSFFGQIDAQEEREKDAHKKNEE